MTNGELKTFYHVSVESVVAFELVERHRITKSKKSHRRKPLNRHTDGCLQLIKIRFIRNRSTQFIREFDLTGIEYVTDVVEDTGSRAPAQFGRKGDYKLYLAGNQHIAAIGVPEAVARTQPGLFVAANRLRPAAEELFIRRQRGRIAQRLAKAQFAVQTYGPSPEKRNVFRKIVAHRIVFDPTAGQRVTDENILTGTPIREEAPVAAVIAPTD